jgi:anaerobic selenocysteine-containing dehydrogenase
LKDGDLVTVNGPAGSMPNVRASEFPTIKAGNAAMYYPEANVLIGRTIDPQSRTPAFKSVVVRIIPESAQQVPLATGNLARIADAHAAPKPR